MEKFRKKERTGFRKLDKEKLGVDQRQRDFRGFEKNLAKWEKLAKEKKLKNDMNAMAAIFKNEIYDKLDPSSFDRCT